MKAISQFIKGLSGRARINDRVFKAYSTQNFEELSTILDILGQG